MLILAPFWPLAAGIIRAVGAIPVPVPYFGVDGSAMEKIQPFISHRTVGVYCNTPNNPSGLMLTPDEVEDLAGLAVAKGWWIYADEVYERLIYEGEHQPLRHFAPNNTISIFSFSKAYAMAGYRCGYVILPNESMEDTFLKGMVHSFYSVPTASQVMAIKVLEHESDWLQNTKGVYHRTGVEVAKILEQPSPTNGTFIFMDIASALKERSFDSFMEACIAGDVLFLFNFFYHNVFRNKIQIVMNNCVFEHILIDFVEKSKI